MCKTTPIVFKPKKVSNAERIFSATTGTLLIYIAFKAKEATLQSSRWGLLPFQGRCRILSFK